MSSTLSEALPATAQRLLAAPGRLVGCARQRTSVGVRPGDVAADPFVAQDAPTDEPVATPPGGDRRDRDRAAEARRLARDYLQRRQRQLRVELEAHR